VLQFSKTCLIFPTLLGTFLLAFTFPAWPQSYPDERPQLIVSVYDDAGVPATVLTQAERQAAKIFDRAGMDVTWLNCSRSQSSPAEDDCNRFEWFGHLALRIRPHSTRSQNEVFGVAFLSTEGTGRYSDVFYDRATELHADWNVGLADILGSVMAHELGHLLLGSNAHSSTGIMRAHWQGEELHRLARGSLGFTDGQADHMREKLNGARPAVALAARSSY
jgi:hypothetical protein